MREAPDRIKDICKHCQKEIIYDKEDGYWDSLEKYSNGIKYYSFTCDENFNVSHEPINFIRNKMGIYLYT